MRKIFIKVACFGSAKAPKDWWLSQSINICRLYYIKGGSGGYIDQNKNKIPFHKGNIYIHPFNLNDCFYTDPTDPIDHIFFDFVSTPPIISQNPLCYNVDPDSPISSFLDFLENLFRSSDIYKTDNNYQLAAHLLQSLLFMLDEQSLIPFSTDSSVCKSLEIIQKNYKNEINVKELAEYSGFEMNYFIRRFKKIMGVTPYTYLKYFRLLKAEELIAKGHTLESVATEVGYQNASSLSRALNQKNKNYTK